MVCGNILRTRLPEGTLTSPLPAVRIFPSVFVKPTGLNMKEMLERLLKFGLIFVQVIKHYEVLAPSKRPRNNKSYDTMVKHADDKLMPAKLQFFGDIAHMLGDFLRGFQTNSPMMPFLCGSLGTMIRRVMKMFIKEDVLNEAVTAFQLIKIKVSETSNQLAISDVRLTTTTEALLRSCSVDKAAKENLRRDCVTFLLENGAEASREEPPKVSNCSLFKLFCS